MSTKTAWKYQTFEVRDLRDAPFVWVSKDVFKHFAPRLQPSSFMVYLVLANFADNATQTCYPSQETIAGILGSSVSGVRNSLRDLEKEGLIATEVTREGKVQRNKYLLLRPPNFSAPSDSTAKKEAFDRQPTSARGVASNYTHPELHSELQTPAFDFGKAILAIREVHPRPSGSTADLKAIRSAITRIHEDSKAPQREICAALYRATKAYSVERAGENPTYTKSCSAWFNGAYYELSVGAGR